MVRLAAFCLVTLFAPDVAGAATTMSAFAQWGGGRLIVYHGWADPIVTPWRTPLFVEGVQRRMRGPYRTDSFLRRFMLPGFDHWRGAGACVPTPSPPVADPDNPT
jgi:feruloyl esterase